MRVAFFVIFAMWKLILTIISVRVAVARCEMRHFFCFGRFQAISATFSQKMINYTFLLFNTKYGHFQEN